MQNQGTLASLPYPPLSITFNESLTSNIEHIVNEEVPLNRSQFIPNPNSKNIDLLCCQDCLAQLGQCTASANIDLKDVKTVRSYDINSLSKEKVCYEHPNYTIAAENYLLNRYANVLPADGTIYCPQEFEGRQLQPYYLNANKIELPTEDKKLVYIAAQAPLKSTLNEYLKAVVAGRSNIVTLAMPIECGVEKCDDYWSTAFWDFQRFFEIKDGENTLGTFEKIGKDETLYAIKRSCESGDPCKKRAIFYDSVSKQNLEQCLIKRTFKFISALTGEVQLFTQIHYKGWPDRGAPDATLFGKLLDILDEASDEASDEKGPLMVHCSAGIGRTGTLIAAHALRRQIETQRKAGKDVSVDIMDLIAQMRKQRAGMVQSQVQLDMICSVVDDYTSAK